MKPNIPHTKSIERPKAKKELIFACLVLNLQASAKENVLGVFNMSKIVKCENCIYMYHCERTYLGGCDTGVEWGEEKEKDEE